MPKATLGQELSAWQIGAKIRRLRLSRSMGLVELGRHTSLSPALLSKVETGKNVPTLSTLQRIAMVFSVGLDHFFRPDDTSPVCTIVRRKDRLRFADLTDGRPPSFWFESLDFPAVDRKLSAYLAEFEPLERAGEVTHRHDGAELMYVIEGTLGLWCSGVEQELEKGDSVYFDSGVAHGYRRLGSRRCSALVTTAP